MKINTNEEDDEENNEIPSDKIDFYEQYGLLLLKFCKYHQYIFLNKKDPKKEKVEEIKDPLNNNNESNNNKTRVVFLLDKIKSSDDNNNNNNNNNENAEIPKKEEDDNDNNVIDKNKGNKIILESMSQKSFISIVQSEEYDNLIRSELNKYLALTKNNSSNPKLAPVIEQINYFLSILNEESFVPLYLSDFNKITITDNFTPTFTINVPAGKTNDFYLETKANETMLVFIEFSLDEKSKDISFQINKYESYTNEFKNIFIEEKVENSFKIFLLCNGYSLYQIVFDNYYSWFTSKDVNYRITLLKKTDKLLKVPDQEDEKEENNIDNNAEEKEEKEEKNYEKDEDKKEKKDENDEDKFYCYFNGKNIGFNAKEICEKIKSVKDKKDDNIINIPVLLYLNTIRIISTEVDENNKEHLIFKEFQDEDEEILTKSFFDYRISNYLSKTLKLKSSVCKDKKIKISLFSLNRELSSLNEDIKEKIIAAKSKTINNTVNDAEYINYLEKIGFYPEEEIEGYKVDCKLYDLCEQNLIYHLLLNKTKNIENNKSILFMLFDDKVCNAAVFNEGAIFSKLKGKNNYLNNININDENGVLDFLESVNETFDDVEVILSWVNLEGECKKKMEPLVEKIKKYCEEKINVKVTIYDEQDINCDVVKYINLFYDN